MVQLTEKLLRAAEGPVEADPARIEVTFRRPVPLYTELEVVAWVEDLGEDLTIARCAIRLDDQDLVTGRGEVIRAERLTSRAGASP